ncbi:SLATT domain-containing protein [Oceanobacillus caeni]|uniref:SLATT domain-containing protein n=1 Tax=Oceanobacillus caeni TaxID=405946 RepID=UPI001C222564|nr:SLATT domain-containing protein [Oceanobacillus caeni]MBU8792163.1 SLATT domain-containing protein [Oceanobacillus caeni]
MNEEQIKSLSNKVWITRKCRINTSDRLVFTNKVTQFLINYYTLVILSISIWSLNTTDNTHFSLFTVIASLFLFGITVGVNSLNYRERIIYLKNCYIKLDDLYADLEILLSELPFIEKQEGKRRFIEIRNEYSKVLESVENHNAYDFLKFQIFNQKDLIDYKHYIRYFLYKLYYGLIFIVLLLVPFSPIILIIKDWI